MSFLKNLPKVFVRSAVRQVGRDGGKVISNKVYKGNHGTPIYNSGSPMGQQQVPYADLSFETSEIDMSIQPKINGGSVWFLVKNVLIQIIPFVTLYVLVKGFIFLNSKTAYVNFSVPNRIADKRHKEGYRTDGYVIIKSKQKRQLTESEVRKQKNKGILCFLAIAVFFFIAYLVYTLSESSI